MENTIDRLGLKDVARVDTFEPVWVSCSRCSQLAYMTPTWPERTGECRCPGCGAIYSLALGWGCATRYLKLPLWFRANFRGHVFWAVNADHLDLLERVTRAKLRERPMIQLAKVSERFKTNQNMPFNLPGWILSAKNRPDLRHESRRGRED
jgi:hypothetical protein